MSIDISTLAIEVRTTGIKEAAEGLQKIATSGKIAEDRVATLTSAIHKLSSAFTSGTGTAAAFEKAMQGTSSSLNSHGASASMLSNSMKELHTSTSKLDSGVSALSSKVKENNSSVTSSAKVMNEAHAAARGLSGSLGALWITYGNLVPMMAGIAVGASLKGVVSVGKEVENTLENIRVLGQSTTEQIDRMRESIYALGTGINSPRDVAKAFEVLTLAGLNANEAIIGIGAALNLATVGGVSIEKSSEALVQVATSLGYSADGFAHVGDVIAKTAAVSMSSVASISGAFKSAASVGELYGASLQDIGTSLATLSNLGIQGTAAGTALKNFYGDLSKGTDKVNSTFKDMQMSLADLKDADGYFLPILEIVTKLDAGLGNLTGPARQEAMTKLFQERGVKDATGLLKAFYQASTEVNEQGEKYANKLQEINEKINKSYGFAALGAIAMSQTTQAQLKAVANTLETTFLKAFQDVAPQIGEVARALTAAFKSDEFINAIKGIAVAVADLTKWIVDHYSWIEKLILLYVGFKAVGIVATLVETGVAFGTATIAARGFTVALGPIAVGIAAVSAAWLYFMNIQKTASGDDSAVKGFKAQVDAMKEANNALTTRIELQLKGESQQSISAKLEEQRQQESIARVRNAAEINANTLEKDLAKKIENLSETEKIQLESARKLEKIGKIDLLPDKDTNIGRLLAEEKKVVETRKLFNNLLVESKNTQEEIIAKSRWEAERADKMAKEGRIKKTGTEELTTKNKDADEKASFLKAEKLNLEKLLETYREKTLAVEESANGELRVMANVEQARVTANFNNKKYASEEIYLMELKLAKKVDEAKFEQQKANAVAEQKNKITEIIQREAAYQKDAENSGGVRLGLIEKQTIALFKFNGESEDSIKKWREMAKVSDQMIASEAARAKIKTATEKLNVDTGSLKQQADALFELGTAGKKSELALAELQVAEGKFANTADQFMTKQYLKAAASKDSAKAYLDASKIASELIDEQLNKEQALLDATLGIEQAKVSAKARAANAIIDLSMKSIEAEIAYNNTFEISSTYQMQQLEKLTKAKEMLADKTAISFRIAGLDDTSSLLDKMSKSVAGMGDSFKGASTALKGFSDAFKTLSNIEKETAKDGKQYIGEKIGAYGDMTDAAKNFFSENSTGYRVLEGVSKAFHAVQLAMNIAEMGQLAIKAVLSQGQGDPYTAWARMATMAAAVGALGFAVGGGFSSSSDNSNSAESVQKTQSTGTVFGDAKAKSESIAKSLEMLTKNSDLMLPLTAQMASSLKRIEDGLSGLANIVLRTQGISDASNMNISTGKTTGMQGTLGTLLGLNGTGGGIGGAAIGAMLGGPIGALLGGVLGKTVGNLLGKLWGSSSSEVTDAGLRFGGNVGALQKGQGTLEQYANVHTESSSWFGLVKSNSDRLMTQGVTSEVSKQVGSVFKNLQNVLVTASSELGKSSEEVGKAIQNFSLDTVKISLKGLSGAEQQSAISNALSAAMDKIATALFPGLDEFSRVGEGYAQTIIRVASGVEQAKVSLESLGIKVVNFSDILNKQGDVATEIIRQSIVAVEGASGVAKIIDQITGSTQDLISTYEALVGVRNTMGATGLNAANLGISTIQGAGGLEALKSGVDDFLSKYFTEAEQTAAKAKSLSATFGLLGKTLPDTKEAYRAMVLAADDGTEAGSKLVGKLLTLSGAFFEVSDSIQKNQESIANAAQKNQEDMAKLAQDGVSSAMTVLTKSIDAQKKIVQAKADADKAAAQLQLESATNLLSSLTSISNMFSSSLSALNPMSRSAAQSLLSSSLSMSNTGGDISKISGLQEALSAVGKPSEQLFADIVSYQKDQQKTINTISALKGNTDKQVSVQQLTVNAINDTIKAIDDSATKQLARLDGIVSSAQAQIDAINGVTNAVLTIPEALHQLAEALNVVKATKSSTLGVTGSVASSMSMSDVSAYGDKHGKDAYYFIKGINDYSAKMESATKLSKTLSSFDPAKYGTPDLALISSTGHDAAYWKSMEDQFYTGQHPTVSNSIPSFAVGTNYVPNDMLANIHAGERIVPAADNAELMSRLRNPEANTAALLQEIRNLKQEMSNVKDTILAGDVANVQATKDVVKIAKKWDSNGMPEVRTIIG